MGSIPSSKEQAGRSEETAESGEETLRKKLSHPPRTAFQKWWFKSRKLLKASHFPCALNVASCIALPASLATGSPGNIRPSVYWGSGHQGQPCSNYLLGESA